MQSLLTSLHNTFTIKDLSVISYFLGIEATRTDSTIHLSQSRYIENLLQRACMVNTKSIATLMQNGIQLSRTDRDSMFDPSLYLSIMGAQQYVIITRPEIAFVVH
jgi:Reverse transcriptase (RNA-dependent DNA polymerase)